jgi:hypothetical protein
VADAGRGVDCAVDPIGDADRNALRLAWRIAEAVNNRILAGCEDLSGAIVAFFERRRLALDEAAGAVLDVMIAEPRLT